MPALVGWLGRPYLHDGGVAVGADLERDVGIAGTWQRDIKPDAQNSLRGLVDRKLRAKIIEANRASAELQRVHVQGVGHEFWVDAEAGYTPADQDALFAYLLDGPASP